MHRGGTGRGQGAYRKAVGKLKRTVEGDQRNINPKPKNLLVRGLYTFKKVIQGVGDSSGRVKHVISLAKRQNRQKVGGLCRVRGSSGRTAWVRRTAEGKKGLERSAATENIHTIVGGLEGGESVTSKQGGTRRTTTLLTGEEHCESAKKKGGKPLQTNSLGVLRAGRGGVLGVRLCHLCPLECGAV